MIYYSDTGEIREGKAHGQNPGEPRCNLPGVPCQWECT